MNRRIQELAERALNEYKATYHNEAKIPEAYLEKFAELVVEQCCNSFPHSGVGPPVTGYDRGYDDAIMSVIPYIKKTFRS